MFLSRMRRLSARHDYRLHRLDLSAVASEALSKKGGEPVTAAEFISHLGPEAKPSKSGQGWVCRCPAHDDRHASLSVTQSGDRVLIHCHAGCTPEDICAAVG